MNEEVKGGEIDVGEMSEIKGVCVALMSKVASGYGIKERNSSCRKIALVAPIVRRLLRRAEQVEKLMWLDLVIMNKNIKIMKHYLTVTLFSTKLV